MKLLFFAILYVSLLSNTLGREQLSLAFPSSLKHVSRLFDQFYLELNKELKIVEFKLENYDSKRSILDANSGKIAGLSFRVHNFKEINKKNSQNLFMLSPEVFDTSYKVISLNKKVNVENIEDLKGMDIGCARGDITCMYYTNHRKRTSVNRYTQLIPLLEKGRVEALFCDVNIVKIISSNSSLSKDYQYSEFTHVAKLHLFLHRKYMKHKDEIEEALKILLKRKTFLSLSNTLRKSLPQLK